MEKQWWYIVSRGKVQIMVYYKTKKPIKKFSKYLFSEYFKQNTGALIAQQFMVEEGSPQQIEMFKEFGLTEKHRDRSVRKPKVSGEGIYEAV